jgi:exodeoxyribonuclease VII large subunit
MPAQNKILSLSDLTHEIWKTIEENFTQSFWIKAEMNKLNFYRQSGHAYPELVEKEKGKIVAQMRCNLWKDEYQHINAKFLRVLKEPLKDGIKILFHAEVKFDPVHGLALRILDIDPSYTLGDLEMEKQQTIDRLRAENLFDANKQLDFPLLPKRIAIISDRTSKGYSDFIHVINGNEWNYGFSLELFSATLQGDNAVYTVIEQLKEIRRLKNNFDAVVIVRGGGADIGLSCYNNYNLAKEITLFPLPVLTGIGHSTNETVCEMIAYDNAITPTKLAEYLIQYFHNFSNIVTDAEKIITNFSAGLISAGKNKFATTIKSFQSATKHILVKNKNDLDNLLQSVSVQSKFFVQKENEKLIRASKNISANTNLFFQHKNNSLDFIQKNVINLSPEMVLKRGYSITMFNGKSVKNIDEIKPGDILETKIADGIMSSNVFNKSKTNE